MTFEVILYLMKKLRLHSVNHRNSYQNRFIICYKEKSYKPVATESRSPGVILVRYRRTYVLNNASMTK